MEKKQPPNARELKNHAKKNGLAQPSDTRITPFSVTAWEQLAGRKGMPEGERNAATSGEKEIHGKATHGRGPRQPAEP